MKKQPYKIIEDIMMYLFGTVGILLMLCVAGFTEGGRYITAAVCLVGFGISMAIASFFYNRKEGIKNGR